MRRMSSSSVHREPSLELVAGVPPITKDNSFVGTSASIAFAFAFTSAEDDVDGHDAVVDDLSAERRSQSCSAQASIRPRTRSFSVVVCVMKWVHT